MADAADRSADRTRTSIIQIGAEGGGVQDTPGVQEVSHLGAQVTRSITGVNCRR